MDVDTQASVAERALEELERALKMGSGSATDGPNEQQKHLAHCEDLERRLRLAIASYRLETRMLVGDQLVEHSARLGKLKDGLANCRSQSSWQRFDYVAVGAVDRADVSGSRNADAPMTLEQAVTVADCYQDASAKALQQTQRMALEAEQIGISTLQTINEQDEQLDRIGTDVEDIKASVSKSRKLLRQIKWGAFHVFGRRRHEGKPFKHTPVKLAVDQVGDNGGKVKFREPDIEDDFLRTKAHMYQLLELVREVIREHDLISASNGICAESARIRHKIRQYLDELAVLLPRLREIQKTARGSWLPGAVKGEELQARYEDIRVLKRQLDEAKELFSGNADTSQPSRSSSPRAHCQVDIARLDASVLLSSCGGQPAESKYAMTSDEERALDHMRRRDGELNRQLGDIGDTADRLNELAGQIGLASKRQKSKADNLAREFEEVDQGIGGLKKGIDKLLKH